MASRQVNARPPPTRRGSRPSSLAALLEQLGDQRGPARLVAGADAGTVVAVKVFVEEDQVLPVRVALELFGPAVDRAPTLGVAQEDAREPARELRGNLPQVEPPIAAGGKRDCERVAVEMVELLQRLDQQVVHAEPHRAAPVRV